MKKRISLFLAIMPVLLLFVSVPSFSAQHKKEDVSSLIADARNRLGSIRSGSSAELVKNEIAKIEESCTLAQNLLTGGKIDEAYNEISLGMLYFQMVDARIDLQKALTELDDTKKNLSK